MHTRVYATMPTLDHGNMNTGCSHTIHNLCSYGKKKCVKMRQHMLPPKLNCSIVDIVYSGMKKEKNTKHWSKTLDAIHNFHDITVEREDIQGIQTCSALQPPRWGDSMASTADPTDGVEDATAVGEAPQIAHWGGGARGSHAACYGKWAGHRPRPTSTACEQYLGTVAPPY